MILSDRGGPGGARPWRSHSGRPGAGAGVCFWSRAPAASPVALFVSSAIVGALVPGIVPLVLGRVHELIPDDPQRQAAAWSVTTVAFALGQAGAGYGFSFLYARTGDYTALFAIAAVTLTTALVIDLAVALAAPRAARSHRRA